MQFRKVTGEERNRLLGSKTSSGFDYTPYLDIISNLDDGDVAAVEIDGSERGEKIRFSRAARLQGRALHWLRNPSENEIAFQITEQRQQARRRGRPRRERTE